MNYCTLFNSQYLSRGLALYNSLLRSAKAFHLYIFAFDDVAFQILSKLNLEFATIVSLQEFETPDLLEVKPTRTIAEYCWTCSSSVILHCLEKYHLSDVCYLDADLYFWQDPAMLLEEAKDYSILITEHRYTQVYDSSAISGKYCVQFMYFKNDKHAMEALYWWRAQCLNWCYNRVEPGLFGDQKYLDDWLQRFEKVKVLGNLGGGVAPWNVQQYQINPKTRKTSLVERRSKQAFDLIFYHFHGLKFVNDKVDLGDYQLNTDIKKTIYYPYVEELLAIERQLKANSSLNNIVDSINIHCRMLKAFSFKDYLRNLKKRINGIYNICSLRLFAG